MLGCTSFEIDGVTLLKDCVSNTYGGNDYLDQFRDLKFFL